MSFANLHLHTEYSLQRSIIRLPAVAKRFSESGVDSAAITDYNSLSGALKFSKEMKGVGIKPILGTEIQTTEGSIVLLAKNLTGWRSLLKIIKGINLRNGIFDLLDLPEEGFGNIIGISGRVGSTISNVLFQGNDGARAKSYDAARDLTDTANWKTALAKSVSEHIEMFGLDNFFLETDLSNQDKNPASIIIAKALRALRSKIPIVAATDPHYLDSSDAFDQNLMVCDRLKISLNNASRKILNDNFEEPEFKFFQSDQHRMFSPTELKEWHSERELSNTNLVSERIEDFAITAPPSLPKFDCPDGLASEEYLNKLCVAGWNRLIAGKVEDIPTYQDRIRHELKIINGANLSDYFLIVSDYIRAAWDRGEITGRARGSAGGCLLSYLIGITRIDPVKYGLLFERFLNEGRLSKDHLTLPDIDTDTMRGCRYKTVDYITNKYGPERVSKVVTFGTLKGKSALRLVLRVREACGFMEQTECSNNIFSDAAVTDDLQEMLEETGEKSTIMLSIQENAKRLEKWVTLKDGKLDGPFATYFEQAMRLEWLTCSEGVHASALIIGAKPLDQTVPMIRSKDGDLIIGVDHKDAENFGLMKADILGLNTLDRIKDCVDMINMRHK